VDTGSGELRCVATDSCTRYALERVRLAQPEAGGVLALRDVALMVSPCCGHVCATSAIRVTPTGMDCPACALARKEEAEEAPDPRICAHCGKRSQLRQAMEQTVLLRRRSPFSWTWPAEVLQLATAVVALLLARRGGGATLSIQCSSECRL